MRDWWGTFEFEIRRPRRWRIGPLELWLARLDGEWRVGQRWHGDPMSAELEVAAEVEAELALGEDLPEELERRRYLVAEAKQLRLTPRVADRPIVTRPEKPLILPAGQRATLYVASPSWVELATGEGAFLCEIPSWLPSGTWFGESTLDGQLCYATRTRARLDSHGQGPGPRVTTAVEVRNTHHEPLRLERIALPLPQMSVFRGHDGTLWTEAVRVDHEPGGGAPAKIQDKPPAGAGETERISDPRRARDTNMVARALSVALRGLMP